jgi:hypothetical protein
VEKSQIEIGKEYGLREGRSPGTPLQHVRILEHVRGKKWRAEWIDPNPGLKDFVDSTRLVVRWKDRRAFLRDEEKEARLQEHNGRVGGAEASPVATALEQVYESVGDDLCFDDGVLTGSPEALRRLRERARINPDYVSGVGYVDRFGKIHVPFDEALEIARAFCAVEPATILTGVESTERQWSQKASQPSGDYIVSLLNEYRASWAMIRQWTGHDPAIAQREATIQRLERLVWDTVYALQNAGLDSEANRLRRALTKE